MKQTYLLLLLTTLLIFGCGDQENTPDTDNNTSTEKEKFKWDFDSEKIYNYSFEQRTSKITDWGGMMDDHVDTSEITGLGDLKIKSKGNNLADFVLANLKLKMDFEKSKLGTGQDELPGQTMVVQDMNANGNFDAKDRSSNTLFEMIFPLPSRDLKIGEKEKMKLEIPYNLLGSPLYAKGYNELEYLKNGEGDRSNIAIFKSKIKVDQLDVPEEIEGEFIFSYIGEGVYEFNFESNHFVAAKIDLNIKMKSEYDSGKDVMGKMDMNMESANQYNIQLIDIENK